jgi:adenosine deaminase
MAAVPTATAQTTVVDVRMQRAFDAARAAGPGAVYALLAEMPKGADLHMHLSGAVYAESFLREGAAQGLCVDPIALKFSQPTAKPSAAHPCAESGDVPAAAALTGDRPAAKGADGQTMTGQQLFDALVDSFSMRGFVPHAGVTGHDQFFATFARFSGLQGDTGAWLDEVATRAARQNEQYLEIMNTPSFGKAAKLGYELGWPAEAAHSVSPQTLAALREKLLAAGLRDEVADDVQQFDGAKAERARLEHCDDAVHAAAACAIHIHWLYQVLRGWPPQQVFAQTLLGFEVASADPDVVGINFVMPEDGRLSMDDYHLQMQMLDYLHSVYPKVHISLHAGELAEGMVEPEGLTFHIREAVELGHAERIGHGVDVLYETKARELLQEMAARHVMVEINLTSNDGILGIKGKEHPLHAYMAAHVPVALSTDDEGVSRIDLTHEYVRAIEEQGLSYAQLKQMARTSLEHAFLHGDSLWAKQDVFTTKKPACAALISAKSEPSAACKAYLDGNEKAALEWEMERRFAVYEASVQ